MRGEILESGPNQAERNKELERARGFDPGGHASGIAVGWLGDYTESVARAYSLAFFEGVSSF